MADLTEERTAALPEAAQPQDPEGAPLPAAGWYGDPKDPMRRRWWDGGQWTDHLRPITAPARHQQSQANAIDTRSSIQGLAEDLGVRTPDGPADSRHATRHGRHAAPAPIAPGSIGDMPGAIRGVTPRPTITWSDIPTSNPPARASLVLGMISILIPIVVPSVIAFIAGGIGLGRAGRGALAVGRRQATWGIILGAVGIAVAATAVGLLLTNPALLAAIGVPTG